jgi:xylulokinase
MYPPVDNSLTVGLLRNADVPRALVRDMYTKSWSAFDRLVAIVPPGGSIGYEFHC